MKEYPIIFSTPMVKAILDGRKTQTRRIAKPQPDTPLWWGCVGGKGFGFFDRSNNLIKCPYGQAGDRLWARETWNVYDIGYDDYNGGWEVGYPLTYIPKEKLRQCMVAYKATDDDPSVSPWRPSIHMPRWASRITLEITEVRVERLKEITEEDAIKEGITDDDLMVAHSEYDEIKGLYDICYADAFKRLWDNLNAKRGYGWDSNCWVWVISFRRKEG